MPRLRNKLITEKTNLLLTRPEVDSEKLSKLLDKKKFNTFIAPLIEIKKKSYQFKREIKYDFLIFTSKNGILNFKDLKKKDRVVVIGDGTYQLAKEMGIKRVINVKGNSSDLKSKLRPLLKHGLSILHPTSTQLNLDLKEFLLDHGCNYYPIGCYNSSMKNSHAEVFKNFFRAYKSGLVTIFSKKTSDSFKNEIKRLNLMENCKAKRILVLSNIIKSELAKFGLKNIFITKEPNEKSMIDLIIKISQKRY